MRYRVERTKINEYDQGDVPAKFRAQVVIDEAGPDETITVENLTEILGRAMGEFNVPARAGLVGKIDLTFRWTSDEQPQGG